jgi:hypothetical protein
MKDATSTTMIVHLSILILLSIFGRGIRKVKANPIYNDTNKQAKTQTLRRVGWVLWKREQLPRA